jgi:hypothetical protein
MDGTSLFDAKLDAAFAAHFALQQRPAGRNDDARDQRIGEKQLCESTKDYGEVAASRPASSERRRI